MRSYGALTPFSAPHRILVTNGQRPKEVRGRTGSRTAKLHRYGVKDRVPTRDGSGHKDLAPRERTALTVDVPGSGSRTAGRRFIDKSKQNRRHFLTAFGLATLCALGEHSETIQWLKH